jgi:hypothetical protein
MTCWVCGRPINDPPLIIGHYRATEHRVAHRRCLQILGELELDLAHTTTHGEHIQ